MNVALGIGAALFGLLGLGLLISSFHAAGTQFVRQPPVNVPPVNPPVDYGNTLAGISDVIDSINNANS